MNKTLIIGVAALTVTLGACGDYGAGAEAEPTTTTAKPKPEIVYRDRRVNVPVEVAPAACLEAIEIAEAVFGLSADIAYAASDGFSAAADLDAAGIRAAARRITAAREDVERLTTPWHTARDDCQAAD